MKRASFCSLMIILSLILLSANAAFSQGIKERMKERLPVILELKNKGIVGENSMGYLEFTGSTREKEDVVEAENSDRQKVYENIAGELNTTAEKVGKGRARQIAQKADPGDWLKDEKGKWYRK